MLRILSEKKKQKFFRDQTHSVVEVLLESGMHMDSFSNEMREGYSENYVRVQVMADIVPSGSELVRLRLGESVGEFVRAEFLETLTYRTALTLLPILQ